MKQRNIIRRYKFDLICFALPLFHPPNTCSLKKGSEASLSISTLLFRALSISICLQGCTT